MPGSAEHPSRVGEMKPDARQDPLLGRSPAVEETLALMACNAAEADDLSVPGASSPPDPFRPPLQAYLDAEEPFFAGFAKAFKISREHKYLVASQKGSMPIPILRHFKEGLDQIARDPFPVYLEPSEVTRRKIAAGCGAPTASARAA